MHRILLAVLLTTLAHAASQPLTVPFLKQQKNGCGAASVAMVMNYWGVQKSGAEVYRTLYDPKLHGIPLIEMKRYLEDQGFRAFTLHGRWADVEQHLSKGRPVVVSLKKKGSSPMHYAVVTGMEKDRVLLNDPTRKGTTRMKPADFEKQWKQADGWMLLAVPREKTTFPVNLTPGKEF